MTEPDTSRPILEVDHLRFAYPDQPPLFDDWSARVSAGVTLLHGDSGAGKSTLLRLLAGAPTSGRASGRLVLAGEDLAKDDDAYCDLVYWQEPASDAFDALTARQYAAEVADAAGRRLALLDEGDTASYIENDSAVDVAGDNAGESAGDAITGFDDAAFQRHLEGFGLLPHADKPLYMLSTGSKRKVWMAVGFACARPLLLLDEPSAALDAASIAYLHRLLIERAADPKRSVVVASYSRLQQVSLAATIELPAP